MRKSTRVVRVYQDDRKLTVSSTQSEMFMITYIIKLTSPKTTFFREQFTSIQYIGSCYMAEDAQLTVICSLIASGNEKFLEVIIENVFSPLPFILPVLQPTTRRLTGNLTYSLYSMQFKLESFLVGMHSNYRSAEMGLLGSYGRIIYIGMPLRIKSRHSRKVFIYVFKK